MSETSINNGNNDKKDKAEVAEMKLLGAGDGIDSTTRKECTVNMSETITINGKIDAKDNESSEISPKLLGAGDGIDSTTPKECTINMSETLTINGKVDAKDKEKSEIFPKLLGAGDGIECTTPKECTTLDYDINKFQLLRVLNNNTRNKSIALLGNFPLTSVDYNAVVILEKQAFQEGDVATIKSEVATDSEENGARAAGIQPEEKVSYFGNDIQVKTEFINSIYGSYQCTPPAKLSAIKATVVYPATKKHIEKYSVSQKYVIRETPELYKNITLPYLMSSQFSLEWVYNILEYKQEAERIIYADPDPENGFILLPDLKWDGQNIDNLYVLALTIKRDIKSIRDLNASHLPMLRNIRQRVPEEIEKRYGLAGTQLRMYFHYQPSFYHLHVHINPLRYDAPGIWCEKAHMLDTVINNLELLPDYYEKATLPFVLYDGNKLLQSYEAEMPIRKKEVDVAALDEVMTQEEDDIEPKAKKPKLDIDM